ncbi:S8 family serine peptidase [Tenacibaculum agarivorans]|uniref:S8 family serine peptidase n=1 Tax=Tenacibaculum agarivorans TaxID=1908389 RepID=UPI0013562ABF|nr:S8 family serine peptidase [Tenacibaculum agarivorans]
MKNFTKVIAILTLIIGLGACAEDELLYNEETTEKSAIMISNQKMVKKNPLAPDIVKDQIVVEYTDKKITKIKKDKIKEILEDRYNFKIKKVEKCNCDNSNIELWTVNFLNPNGGVEDLVGPHDVDEDGVADLNADFQFSFFIKEKDQSIMNGYMHQLEQMVHPNTTEDRVNIAVIDTGVNYDYFDTPFLYNGANDTSNCLGNEVSGWDFVNNDHDVRDDHGHGTFVSAIIRDILTQENIPYQILPVKAFDQDGKGTYFNILCSLQYIASKKKPFMVNCSFGFYNLKSQIIFEKIVEENSNNLLLMASAGNDEKNTDSDGNEHFPSGYKSDNLLAVGGYIVNSELSSVPYLGALYISGYNLAPESNYGNTSIDIVAAFDYDLTLIKGRKSNQIIYDIPLRGTSFSCPVVTARAAALYHRANTAPRLLKSEVIASCYKDHSLRDKINNSNVMIIGNYRVPDPIGPFPWLNR